jgi:hypothetical protein
MTTHRMQPEMAVLTRELDPRLSVRSARPLVYRTWILCLLQSRSHQAHLRRGATTIKFLRSARSDCLQAVVATENSI